MRSAAVVTALAGLAFVAPELVSAHVGAGFPGRFPPEMKKRVAKRGMQRRQFTYNDQSWQTITSPKEECTAYGYPPTSNWNTAFPTSWKIASIVQGDTEAQNAFNALQGQIPNIQPKGVPTNSMQGVSYNENADPDCWWTESTCTKPKLAGLKPDLVNCPEPNTWGYTFDDGPNCTHNAFYDFLKENKQTATLFYIGSNVLDWPLQAQRGLTDGHQIGVHTWSHRYTTSLSNEQVFAEFYYTIKAIKWTCGVTPTAWRPPYGDVDDRVRWISSALGLETVMWAADTNDWAVVPGGTAPSSEILGNYASIISSGATAAAGPIVLTHEINNSTMYLAMQEYANIKKEFAHIVPVHTCMNDTLPYKEDIVYPDFAEYIAGTIMPSSIPSASNIKVQTESTLLIGTSKPSYSVTNLQTSTAATSGTSNSPSAAASTTGSKGSDAKKGGAAHAHGGAAGVAGAALAAAGGAAALFV